jgi:hypothetical protein
MAKITVQLKESRGNARYNFIYIDGIKMGTLSSLENESFTLSEGDHTLQIRFGLMKLARSHKVRFSVSANEEIFFLAYNRKKIPPFIFFLAISIMTVLGQVYFFKEPFTTEKGILLALVCIVLLIPAVLIIRYVTFKIEEVDPKDILLKLYSTD